jgi:hypothetical protein
MRAVIRRTVLAVAVVTPVVAGGTPSVRFGNIDTPVGVTVGP